MTTPHIVTAMAVSALLAATPTHAQRGLPAAATVAGPVSISGKVVDANGRPAPGALVSVLRKRTYSAPELREVRHQYRFGPADVRIGGRTDGKGQYVLSGLPPGQYVVVVIPLSQPFIDQKASPTGYATTYYPNARSADAATLVTVVAGQVTTADIKIGGGPLVTVSGSVVSAKGLVVKGGTLHMSRGDGLFGLGSGNTTIKPDGTFAIRAMAPGTYFLRYNEDEASTTPASARTALPRVSGATVVVAGQDLSGVRVEPIKPVRVSGKVIVKANSGPKAVNLSSLRVLGAPFVNDGTPGPQLPGPVGKDLRFEFQTWPSLGYVRVLADKREIIASAVRVKGVDVTRSGIEFVPGAFLTDVEIEITIK